MANVFKPLTPDNISITTNYVNANIPITGTLVSSSLDANIKNYAHDMFQSVYDYDYTSPSANKLFDITFGFSQDSTLNTGPVVDAEKKVAIYNQMCQVLNGYDENGNILKFDEDGNHLNGGTKMKECIFISFSRLLTKDKIKRGSFSFKYYEDDSWNSLSALSNLTDSLAVSSYLVNSPSGEYSRLNLDSDTYHGGLLFYEAGVLVLTGSVIPPDDLLNPASWLRTQLFQEGTIPQIADVLRNRYENCVFNNTTKINSVTYFLNVGHKDFNYSSNKTFLEDSKIVTKNNPEDLPTSFITSIGLYSADNELLAVGKLSEPKRKTPNDSFVLKARLDY